MTGNMWIYCPYCGAPQSEEWEIMNLLRNEVFSLNCRACEKSCVLILYDEVQSSVTSTKKELPLFDGDCPKCNGPFTYHYSYSHDDEDGNEIRHFYCSACGHEGEFRGSNRSMNSLAIREKANKDE